MKRIKLTQGKYALVSDRDYTYLNQWKWCACKYTNTWYAQRTVGPKGGQHKILMHRVILGLQAGNKRQGDHRDGNGLNNQRRNLRVATPRQNQHNQPRRCNNTCGYKCIYLRKDRQKWHTRITVNGKKVHVGYFDSPIEAAKAYDKAARKHHGKFARVNFA